MSSVFTEFVHQLQPGSPEPTAEHFEALWDALRGTLAVEMKRRSVWSSPPRFLGVIGRPTWAEPGGDTDALDELAAECFEFVFVRRLESLAAQAEEKPEIDGLVLLAVRHFLLEMQKRHDPLGFRVFEIWRDLVRDGVEAGRLEVLAGPAKVRNDTILALAGTSQDLDERADPAALVDEIARRHLVGLVTASHGALVELKAEIFEALHAFLAEAGKPLRFGDLAREIKTRVRAAWAIQIQELPAVVEGEGAVADGSSTEPRGVYSFEERRRLDKIIRCVEKHLRRLDAPAKTRTYLELLWRYAKTYAEAIPEAADSDTLGVRPDGKPPSHRKLSQLLGIPRGRIPELFETLGERVNRCRDRLDTPGGPPPMSSGSFSPRDHVRASARTARESLARREPTNDTPFAPGDLLHLRAAASGGTAWLVLATAPGAPSESLRLVAADTFPLFGPVDLAVGDFLDDLDSPWITRPAHQVTIPAATLRDHGASRIARLPADAFDALGRALEVRPDADDPLGDADLPAYQEHIEEGPADARRRLESLARAAGPRRSSGSTPGPTSPRRSDWIRRQGPVLLAAALALAVVGLGLRVRDLDRKLGPILDPASAEIAFDLTPRGARPLERPDRTHVQFILLPPRDQRAEAYRIEVVDDAGREIFSSPWVESFEPTLVFPVEDLLDDPIHFRLYGRVDGVETLLDEQSIEWLE